MMDEEFCNKKFPFAWRSSMAISAYEPKPEDLPEELCGDRITYIKITTTITGYQPGREVLDYLDKFKSHLEGTVLNPFPNTSTTDVEDTFERLFGEYFACYGSLLNVAVFPYPNKKKELVERIRINFSQLRQPGDPVFLEPGTTLDNPYEHSSGVTFEASGEAHNRLINIIPQGGGSDAELNIHTKMVISIPATAGLAAIEAKVTYAIVVGVKMEAFRAGESVGTALTEAEPGQVHTLLIEADDIDTVVLTAPEKEASLLEFAYFTAKEVALTLEDYPHIIDFEPKTRDLYQAATEAGEILTGSKSGVTTNKALTHTDSTQDSFKLGSNAGITIPGTPITFGHSIEASRTNIETDQNQWSVQTDASRERRETQGTTTQLSQMYNLLTGYHAGTNRAVFLMLARPHVLQPTDFRTFVQGLRAIEGMQEYFLIVSRPEGIEGLCIETSLETGHFPEDSSIEDPPTEYEESHEDFIVTAESKKDGAESMEEFLTSKYAIGLGWVIDRTRGDTFHSGIRFLGGKDEKGSISLDNVDNRIKIFNYQPIDDGTVQVVGRVLDQGDVRHVELKFRVFTRREQPKKNHEEASAKLGRLLITNRGLCACFKSGECLEIVPPPVSPEEPPRQIESIVDEPMLKMKKFLLNREASSQSRLPAMKEFLQKIQTALTTSFRSPKRHAFGNVGFLESDYFKDQIKQLLPERHLKSPIGQVKGLPDKVVKALGDDLTIEKALSIDLARFAQRTGLSIEDASKARHQLLGIAYDSGDDVSMESDQEYGDSEK